MRAQDLAEAYGSLACLLQGAGVWQPGVLPQRCFWIALNWWAKVPGVQSAHVNVATHRATVSPGDLSLPTLVEALDRARLLSDITMALSDAHVNILSANLQTSRDRVAKSRFTFEMAEAKHLETVLKNVRNVPGVFDAYRVTG